MKFLLSALIFTIATSSARAGVVVVGNLARTATVQPGGTFEGVIFLKNTDAKPAEARVFQTDYLTQADGSNYYEEAGTTARSNATWITLTPSRIKLAPGESVPVRYKGRAPADGKLRGTYWSMIMVEPSVSAPASPQGKTDNVAVGLRTQIRFGVQIVTEVGREGTRSLHVVSKSLVKDDARRMLQVDIGNNGEKLIIPAITVELFDGNGASIGRFDGGRTRIYPACSVRSQVNLSDVPPGKYTAMVLLDGGDDQVMGAQYDLELEP